MQHKENEELFEAAMKYVQAGYKILPVIENGKTPQIEGGFHKATDDLEQIKKWWAENPNYNIGLPMALNGLIAVDIDRHDEIDGFMNLERHCLSNDLPDLPVTVEAITPNNGRHKIYKAPKNFKPAGKLTKGVDIRYNAYIVVAPSKIDKKHYEWIEEQGLLEMQPANLPEEYIRHLTKPEQPKHTKCENALQSNYPASNAEKVAENCNFIKHCIEHSQILPEPDWKFGVVGVITFCENGIEFVHSWSENYNGYTVEQTDKKVNYALQFGHPSTCEGIQNQCGAEYCTDCEYNGKIKSPIVLG